jgi:UDP:flavonoid glycosyltransferase YjiC (YdhE family)
MLRLASACRSRGHAVLIAANPIYAERARAAGVAFAPIGPRMRTPSGEAIPIDLSARGHGLDVAGRWLDLYVERQTVECRRAIAAFGGADAIVASWITPGAVIAAETAGVPLVFAHISPLTLMQAADFPVLSALPRVSACAKRSAEAGRQARAAVARRYARAASRYFELRARLRLPSYEGALFEGPPRPAARLALFSRHLAHGPPNMPTEIVGFLPPAATSARLEPAVAAFLAYGPPPVLVSLGSALSLSSPALTSACIAAARRLGRRTIVLTMRARITGLAAPDVLFVRECPPALILPHCAALVTHAGIGTVGDGLGAGAPMLCLPHYGDQFDNAARVEAAGVGITLMPGERDEVRVEGALRRLLDERRHRQAASAWPQILAAENAGARAVEAIERTLR